MSDAEYFRYADYSLFHAKRESGTLVISFSGIGMVGHYFDNGDPMVYWDFSEHQNDIGPYQALYVRDLTRSWFNEDAGFTECFDKIIEIATAPGIRRVVTIGLGMGAFGALYLASRTPVSLVIALSPQSAIAPVVLDGIDRRWAYLLEGREKFPRGDIAPLDLKADRIVALCTDEFREDVWHLLRLAEAKHAETYIFPGRDQNIAYALGTEGMLVPILQHLIAGSGDSDVRGYLGAHRLSPQSAALHHYRAQTAFETGRADDALYEATMALALRPDIPGYKALHGRIKHWHGEQAAAAAANTKRAAMLEPEPTVRNPVLRFLNRQAWFGTIVLLPTLVSAVYLFAFASDLYVSEARYIIRSPNRSQFSLISTVLQGTGLAKAQDDTYAVNDFLRSRDAVAAIEAGGVDLRQIYGRTDADVLSRYPNPVFDETEDGLFRYYLKQVALSLNGSTGITTLSASAFRPEDAQVVARAALVAGETLINQLSVRAQENALSDAQNEVANAENRVKAAERALLDYRERELILDPTQQSALLIEGIAKLQAQLSAANAQLTQVLQNSPRSPLIPSLRAAVRALEGEIEREQAKVAGTAGAMAQKLGEYQFLIMEQVFSEVRLTAATAGLELARMEAQRQHFYLERVVEPGLPDKAIEPRRATLVATIFVFAFLAFSTLWVTSPRVRNHGRR
ncbi:hypothetical protein [Zavarzinia compransoris]|uniref:Capsule biosynthesis protein n=1 Tax=Zavarzinia compransoris TaxID=1264899 RepID=A0A317DU64_9PROT|nr:hypothetical protein [Zavarzinia compransoris]PWR18227.1 hypothetical protein DKG75_19855 [Zavarzinia compransoris]TDP40880.1 BexC/CtrB/KpsE family polysaccharide export inner-membrane protein [Zavarzinia compransoris]